MDFYRNVDKLACEGKFNTSVASGVQYRVISDLDEEPVSLDFFKEHARIDFDTDDTLATSYLKAARLELEAWAQLSFGVKTIRLMALTLPDNYRLMYGQVDEVLTDGFENFGDILLKGGRKVDITYTTLDWINDDIRIAICRYAAGLYVYRENESDGNKRKDEAKEMVRPYMNISIF